MLKLLLGASGSGKTTLLYQRIRARAEAGGRSILLVPEQFTSSTEGRIHRELGDALSGLVESFSFTSLAEHILSAEGGSAVQTLSDAGRAVLVRRALEELQDNVHYYYRHRRSAAFCQMAAETIDELKSAGLSGQRLYALAQECGADSAKLSELALIFQGYETLLAGTGMDPSDRLTLAASRLENALARGGLPEFLRGREVFIDEFDTFNAPKKRLMGALLASLPTVTVALCDDGAPLIPGDMSLFSGAKQVAAQLRQLARRSGTEVAMPELLRRDVRHADAPGLAAAARLLASGQCDPPPACPEIKLFAAPSREEEARAAAAAIRRLMRQGVRCGRVAVVCRDIAKYRAAVRYEFRMADIPLYCDEPTTPEFSAPATAVRCLLAIARGAELTEQLTTLAKTGLCALTEEEVCALENYAYTWSPGAAAWRAPFEKNPRGFGDADPTAEDTENLARAEKARALLVTAADGLRAKLRSASAEQMSRALYFCLKELGAEEAQAAQVEAIRAERGIPAAEEAAREWNVVMGLLDEMASLLGGQSVTIAEYEELFGLLLRSSDLGHIPQTLDAVVLASAGKMRLDAPDYVFVLGLSEGEFPAEESFPTFLEQALCFFAEETAYRSSPSPFGIKLVDRLSGIPLHLDISDEPIKRGITTNRNKFVLGPSGSGKSFFMNHLIRHYYEQGAHVLLIDTGNSYKGLCELIHRRTRGEDGIYLNYTDEAPICFNPFYVEDGVYDVEKRESIKTLILTLWKREDEAPTRSEEVALSNAVNLYLTKIKSDPAVVPSFDTFYEFVATDYRRLLQQKKVREKDFDWANFLNVLEPFYRGGEYDYLLNSNRQMDLLHKRFIVFELDNISENRTLLPVVTIIIMETFLAKMRRLQGVRKVLLLEEAWKAIAKEGMASYVKYLCAPVQAA